MPPSIAPFSFGDAPLDAGALAQVQCVVTFGDLPVEITWTFHGSDATKRSQTGVSIMKVGSKSSLLIIESVSTENSGNYTCTAKNGAGVSNYTAELIVNGQLHPIG